MNSFLVSLHCVDMTKDGDGFIEDFDDSVPDDTLFDDAPELPDELRAFLCFINRYEDA